MIVQLPDHLYFGGLNFNMEFELMKINLKNDAGLIKQCPVGFSWTILMCGPFVPLIRGDFKWFLWMCIPGLYIIMAFIYNKIYIQKFLMQGFKPADDFSKSILQQKGIIANENGVITNQSSSIKKIVIGVIALFIIIAISNKNSAPKIDLNTAAATIDIEKLNNTLFDGTDLQKDEIKKQSKNGVLETYIYIEDTESAANDCIRIKSMDQIGYRPIFKTNSIVCANEKISKDKLLSLKKGETVKIKGVVRDFDTYTDILDNFKIIERYIVKLNPAIITEIVK